jgi:hypothetical protein
MTTKKKRLAGRAAKKRNGRKRVAVKRASPKSRSSISPRRATGRQSTRKKRASKSAAVRRKERKVDEARRQLIEAEKELAAEELPKIVHPRRKSVARIRTSLPGSNESVPAIQTSRSLNRAWKRAWLGQIQ